jgi:hypothetical protein
MHPEFKAAYTAYQENLKLQKVSSIQVEDEPEIIMLGTCSMMPTSYRNVSAIAVQLTSNQLMLLDCGEGTY